METMNWTVSGGTIAVMALVGLFAAALPLGLGIFFHRRAGGRWRYFLVGCGVFLLFALILERLVHSWILGGPLGGTIQSSLGLYALYAGLMAGLFEECGRFCAFRLLRRGLKGPEDALMYGAGHGGFEAAALTGLLMLNNVVTALVMNQGGLAAVEGLNGPIPDAQMAALAGLAATPAWMYLWSGFERLAAVGLHIALSVLVYAAATRRSRWYWFPVAIGIHWLVDTAVVLIGAAAPIFVTEGACALMTLGAALLAWRVYHRALPAAA